MRLEPNNTHLSLFSGIGGLDLAAEWAGFRTVAFVERDKYCQRVLAKHWPGVPICDDVCQFRWDGERPAVVSGGFPCQPYSSAGRGLGNEDDRALWPEYLRIIQECRPAWVVGENVVGIVNLALDGVLADLEGIGYSARAFDIPACAAGAPHERRRIFIVAHASSERQQESRDFGQDSIRYQTNAKWKTTDALNAIRWGNVPALCREDDGLPSRMERLKALGNAVVPQQAYPIFRAIAKIEGIQAL